MTSSVELIVEAVNAPIPEYRSRAWAPAMARLVAVLSEHCGRVEWVTFKNLGHFERSNSRWPMDDPLPAGSRLTGVVMHAGPLGDEGWMLGRSDDGTYVPFSVDHARPTDVEVVPS